MSAEVARASAYLLNSDNETVKNSFERSGTIRTTHTFEDDMESIYYVVLYCATLLTPFTSETQGIDVFNIFQHMFDQYSILGQTGRPTGGDGKSVNKLTRRYTNAVTWVSRTMADWIDTVSDFLHPIAKTIPARRDKWNKDALHHYWSTVILNASPLTDLNDRINNTEIYSKEFKDLSTMPYLSYPGHHPGIRPSPAPPARKRRRCEAEPQLGRSSKRIRVLQDEAVDAGDEEDEEEEEEEEDAFASGWETPDTAESGVEAPPDTASFVSDRPRVAEDRPIKRMPRYLVERGATRDVLYDRS